MNLYALLCVNRNHFYIKQGHQSCKYWLSTLYTELVIWHTVSPVNIIEHYFLLIKDLAWKWIDRLIGLTGLTSPFLDPWHKKITPERVKLESLLPPSSPPIPKWWGAEGDADTTGKRNRHRFLLLFYLKKARALALLRRLCRHVWITTTSSLEMIGSIKDKEPWRPVRKSFSNEVKMLATQYSYSESP